MVAEKKQDLVVFVTLNESRCGQCGAELFPHSFITLAVEAGALCMSCSDLDHLSFLPSGNMALTLRSKKYSKLWAVVLKWRKPRKRYERQGLLVEEAAVERAEQECLADDEVRRRRRERQAEKRKVLDEQYVRQFSLAIREQYPCCPTGVEVAIAEHACRKYSGRVGRAAFAKEFKPKAIELAVVAHIRHTETAYDELLLAGHARAEAREQVWESVQHVLAAWEKKANAC
jgi:hypothetical protein